MIIFTKRYAEEYFKKKATEKFLAEVLKKAYQTFTLTPDGKLVKRQEQKQ